MQEQALVLTAAVSVFKLNKAGGSAPAAVAKLLAPPAETSLASLREERRLPGHSKQGRAVKAKEDYEKHLPVHPKDGEWKEF